MIFKVVDEASATIRKLMDMFNQLERSIKGTQDSLKTLRLPNGFVKNVLAMGEALEKIGPAAESAATTVNTSFDGVNRSLNVSTDKVVALKNELRAAASEARNVRQGLGSGVGPGLFSGGGDGGGAHRPTPDARNMRYGHGGQTPFHASEHLGPIGFRTHDPFGLGTVVVAAGVWEAFKQDADLKAIQLQLRNNGVSEGEIEKATREAYAYGQRFGQPVQMALGTINEIRNPLNKTGTPDGGVESALAHMDTLMRAAVILRNLDKKNGGSAESELYDIVKAGEMRNAIGDASFDSVAGAITRADEATGGKVTPRQTLQFYKYLRGALPGLSDKFLFSIGPELIQEFNGSSGGTALAADYQQIVAGQQRTTGLRLLDKLGEIDRSKVEFDKDGRIVRSQPGANKLDGVFEKDPVEYASRVIKDLDRIGVHGQDDQTKWLAQIYGNRNSAYMIAVLAYQKARLERGAAGYDATLSIKDESDNLMKDNPWTKFNAMTASFQNMMTSIGDINMGTMTETMRGITIFFNDIRRLVQDPAFRDWKNHVSIKPAPMTQDMLNGGAGGLTSWLPKISIMPKGQVRDGVLGPQDTPGLGGPITTSAISVAPPVGQSNGAVAGFLSALKNWLPSVAIKMAPPPAAAPPKVDTSVLVKVYVDGKQIAAAVESYVSSFFGGTNHADGHDGRANPTYPGTVNGGY